jgi:hypothetical protein
MDHQYWTKSGVALPVVAFKKVDRVEILNGHRFTTILQQSESDTSTVTLEREGHAFDVTNSEFATHFR